MGTIQSALYLQRAKVRLVIGHCEPSFQRIVRNTGLLSTSDSRRLAKT